MEPPSSSGLKVLKTMKVERAFVPKGRNPGSHSIGGPLREAKLLYSIPYGPGSYIRREMWTYTYGQSERVKVL